MAKPQQKQPDWTEQFTKPFVDYWNRWGQHARSGLDMAEQGAQSVRQGDLSGLGGMLLGPAGYVASPLSALVPRGAEEGLPKEAQPFARGLMDLADVFMPGPGELTGLTSAMLVPARFAPKEAAARLPEYLDQVNELKGKAQSTAELDAITQQLWEDTRWDMPSVDLHPRTEISDALVNAHPSSWPKVAKGQYEGKLHEFLTNPELYRAAPELAEIPTRATVIQPEGKGFVYGGYNPALDEIELQVPTDARISDIITSALHETSHAIDKRIGVFGPYTPGNSSAQIGNPDAIRQLLTSAGYADEAVDPFRLYLKLATENLARNNEGRFRALFGLTPNQGESMEQLKHPVFRNQALLDDPSLRRLAPSLTNPVPFEEQIYQYSIRDPLENLTPRQLRGIYTEAQ